MQFSPNVRMIINFGLAALGVIVAGGASIFPDYVPPGVAKDIVQTSGLVLAIASGIGGTMSVYSSPKQGPGAPTPPAVIVTAQKVAELPPDASTAVINQTKAAAVLAVDRHQP